MTCISKKLFTNNHNRRWSIRWFSTLLHDLLNTGGHALQTACFGVTLHTVRKMGTYTHGSSCLVPSSICFKIILSMMFSARELVKGGGGLQVDRRLGRTSDRHEGCRHGRGRAGVGRGKERVRRPPDTQGGYVRPKNGFHFWGNS